MRALFLPLLMASLSAAAAKPEKMFVVVHTSDRVVAQMVCSKASTMTNENRVIAHEVLRPGSFTWHVVGGVAPYTVIKDETFIGGNGCITVMDGTGQTATGCGVVQVHNELIQVPCRDNEDPCQQPAIQLHKDSVCPTGKKPAEASDHKAQPSKYVPPVKLPDPAPRLLTERKQVEPRNHRDHHTGRVHTTRTPNRTPNPGPEPRHVKSTLHRTSRTGPVQHTRPGTALKHTSRVKRVQ